MHPWLTSFSDLLERRLRGRIPTHLCAGFIETDPISRVSLVTQLICRLYPLGVRVWKLLYAAWWISPVLPVSTCARSPRFSRPSFTASGSQGWMPKEM